MEDLYELEAKNSDQKERQNDDFPKSPIEEEVDETIQFFDRNEEDEVVEADFSHDVSFEEDIDQLN